MMLRLRDYRVGIVTVRGSGEVWLSRFKKTSIKPFFIKMFLVFGVAGFESHRAQKKCLVSKVNDRVGLGSGGFSKNLDPLVSNINIIFILGRQIVLLASLSCLIRELLTPTFFTHSIFCVFSFVFWFIVAKSLINKTNLQNGKKLLQTRNNYQLSSYECANWRNYFESVWMMEKNSIYWAGCFLTSTTWDRAIECFCSGWFGVFLKVARRKVVNCVMLLKCLHRFYDSRKCHWIRYEFWRMKLKRKRAK